MAGLPAEDCAAAVDAGSAAVADMRNFPPTESLPPPIAESAAGVPRGSRSSR